MKLMRGLARVGILLLILAAVPAPAKSKTCPNCGNGMEQVNVGTRSPSCTEGGILLYRCLACGTSSRETVKPLGHSYRVISSREATCTEEGVEKQRCTRCGDIISRILPAIGHEYVLGVSEPTCETAGANIYTCANCADSYAEPIPAVGHSYALTVSAPTCTEAGANTYTCANCSDSYAEPIPAVGHSYALTVSAPTCTEAGANLYTCANCADSYAEPIPAVGHSYGEWVTVKAPTFFKTGAQERTCSVCGDVQTQPVPKKKLAPLVIAIGIASAAIGAGTAIRRRRLKGAAKAAEESASLGTPTVKMKKLLLCLKPTPENAALEALLREKLCFSVKTIAYGDTAALAAAVKEQEPHITVLSAQTPEEAQMLEKLIHEVNPEQHIGMLGEEGMDKSRLQLMKEGQTIRSMAMHSDSNEAKLIRLAMVAYRPDVATGDYISNLTLITDALGLSFVSTLINAYGVKGDISDIIARHGTGDVSSTADSLNDIAGLFGLEGIADLAGKVRVLADQLGRNKQA